MLEIINKTTNPQNEAQPASIETVDNLTKPNIQTNIPNNGSPLIDAIKKWKNGDWNGLIKIKKSDFINSTDRSIVALFIACAWQQRNNQFKARHFVHLAKRWGCDHNLIKSVLIANIHNTLGRISALLKDDDKISHHFRNAVSISCSEAEMDLACHARSVREMANMGLLTQAAILVDRELKKTKLIFPSLNETQAHIKVLETEIELLHHELSLAQQRQQLYGKRRKNKIKNGSFTQKDANWQENLKRKSFSQLGQDIWVLEQTHYKEKGFFVEFGATDGVLLSNTYLLEKEFGWHGICAEPNPKFYKKLKINRNCIVSNACISGETGKEVEFIFADAYGGFKEYADSDMHADKRQAYANKIGTVILSTISLHDFLVEHNAPIEIDYLSVDTEGSEFEILSVFPFEDWKIKVLTIEHNFTPQRYLIRSLLLRNGYECIEKKFDDWYVMAGG